jgi:hypothetical protein
MTLVAALMTVALLPTGAAAQPKPASPRALEAPAAPAAAVDEQTARETRDRLHQILEQYPPSVGQVLRLDPSLIAKPDYMAPYPSLASYLAQHPEVAHNPVFFLGGPGGPGQQYYSDNKTAAMRAVESVLEGLEFLIGFMTAVLTLGWLARAGIEHRRWVRATRIQVDAHTKIVDRLSSNEDLLTYMQSATGQQFLSASLGVPAPAAAPLAVGAPFNRILWSVQVGIVVAAAGLGLWLAKNGVIDEVAQPLQVISILAMALGAGFVASAFASYALSRQLGLVQPQQPHA